MAITLLGSNGLVGSGNEKVSDGTLNVTMSAATQVGDILYIALTADNLATSGSNGPFMTWVIDPRGHTWTGLRQVTALNATAAGAACVLHIWRCVVTTPHVVGDILTAQLGTVTAKAAIVLGVRGATVDSETGWVSSSGSSGGPAYNVTPSAIGDMIIGFCAQELNTVPSGDSDTLEGNWSTVISANTTGGSGNTNVAVMGQTKIVTGTSQQQFNISVSSDFAAAAFKISASPVVNSNTNRMFAVF